MRSGSAIPGLPHPGVRGRPDRRRPSTHSCFYLRASVRRPEPTFRRQAGRRPSRVRSSAAPPADVSHAVLRLPRVAVAKQLGGAASSHRLQPRLLTASLLLVISSFVVIKYNMSDKRGGKISVCVCLCIYPCTTGHYCLLVVKNKTITGAKKLDILFVHLQTITSCNIYVRKIFT